MASHYGSLLHLFNEYTYWVLASWQPLGTVTQDALQRHVAPHGTVRFALLHVAASVVNKPLHQAYQTVPCVDLYALLLMLCHSFHIFAITICYYSFYFPMED